VSRTAKNIPVIVQAIVPLLTLAWVGTAGADMGFAAQYEWDYNIFNSVDKYQLDNPLNPANKYNPNVPFAPLEGGSSRGNTKR
jgi:hypothetical protein